MVEASSGSEFSREGSSLQWPQAAATGVPYETLFMASPLAASLTRLCDGRLLAVNDAWQVLTGLRREAVLGRTTVDIGHWPDAGARARYLSEGPPPSELQYLRLRDGVEYRVRLHATVLSMAGDPAVLIYMTDATTEFEAEAAQVRSEQALREANRRLEQQVELHAAIEKLAHVGHWINAQEDAYVDWSPGLHEITGVPPGERLRRADALDPIHPEDLPVWREARAALDGREVEFRWLRPDGQTRRLRTRIGQTTVGNNRHTAFGVVQDITAEREASERLAEQYKLLQNIAARVPGMMYEARLKPDGTSVISYVNEVAHTMLEVAPKDLEQNASVLFDRVHPDDRAEVIASLNASARQLSAWRQTYRVCLPTAGVRWQQVEAMPQREADGSVVWHGFSTDVTAGRLAAQKLERQHRMLEAVRAAQTDYIEADDKRKAFEGLLQGFLSVTGSEFGFVGEVLYDDNGKPYLRTSAVTNIAWDEASRLMYQSQAASGMAFRNLDTLFGHAMLTGQPVITNDPTRHPRAGGLPSGHPPMNAFLGVPLAVGERMVAMVGLANQPGGYSEEDIEFLQPLLGAVRQLVMAWRGHLERRRTREQLQITSELLTEKSLDLQATLDSIDQGLCRVDDQNRVTAYNRRLLEMLDLPEALLQGQPTTDQVLRFQTERGDFGPGLSWVDPVAHSHVLHGVSHVQSPDKYWRKTQDGRILEMRTRTLPDGGLVRTFSDVSSYVQAQDALREERQRLAWVLEATRPGVWENNLVDNALTVNDRWVEMLGYTADELRPMRAETWEALVHPDDLRRADDIRDQHLSGALPYYECDIRMRHKSGRWIWVNTRGRVHKRDVDGRGLFMSGTHIDITDRVAAQEQVRALNANLEQRVIARTAELERSMRDMEAISYSIAHDLRSPLRSVNGFAAIVLEEEADRLSPNGRDMFERIARSSRNMGQMITDMLELLRVVRVDLEAVPVDMVALAHSVADALSAQSTHARIRIDTMPFALGDATLLRQVLANLMDNALKYSMHVEQPELEVGYDAEQRVYFVRDNGIGFDMAHADKLFGLFQRLHAGSSVPGMGVGLAIVARIVERHGGRVWAESKPGEGATFWLRLPQA
ncbi:PAS domain-containing protein [Hydrogenophaga sp. BPS33]|uniref:PAS domain-containing protein n=1 Tax=Hydrogenophaga sp. BPS33 TaxID=2651974 RepID=UPI00132007F1|nr:PAS domain-containing protein [Hydrogenophaga sp. BPS33]QHE85410.1 PAS domain-containing protein [Hydrogenophaga sp. BPS33]